MATCLTFSTNLHHLPDKNTVQVIVHMLIALIVVAFTGIEAILSDWISFASIHWSSRQMITTLLWSSIWPKVTARCGAQQLNKKIKRRTFRFASFTFTRRWFANHLCSSQKHLLFGDLPKNCNHDDGNGDDGPSPASFTRRVKSQ